MSEQDNMADVLDGDQIPDGFPAPPPTDEDHAAAASSTEDPA